MHKSTDRILTTHAGSIPRGEPLGTMLIDEEAGKPVDKSALQSNIDLRVWHVLEKQAEAGVDIVNDGEQGRVGFQTYVTQRMSGFGGVSKRPYAETITHSILRPLGMESSGFVADAMPAERRALGYRGQDNAWHLEPTLAHGAFGAMGGLQTSANDYAKWVEFLLAAWPPRDGAASKVVARATIRELAEGSNFPRIRERFGHRETSISRLAGVAARHGQVARPFAKSATTIPTLAESR